MLLALARNHKKVYGRTNLKTILQQTRDIRTFSLTPEQYREFSRQAKDKVLFAGIQDKEQPDAPIDLVIPTTDLELANVIFERLFGSLEKLSLIHILPVSRPVPCLPGVFKYGNPQNRIHLTEKPLQLMQDLVKITEPGGHILDPFAGSGTTVLAAIKEGYNATGCLLYTSPRRSEA